MVSVRWRQSVRGMLGQYFLEWRCGAMALGNSPGSPADSEISMVDPETPERQSTPEVVAWQLDHDCVTLFVILHACGLCRMSSPSWLKTACSWPVIAKECSRRTRSPLFQPQLLLTDYGCSDENLPSLGRDL